MAFVAAMIGLGGGVLYTPIQLFFDIDIHEAAATSLLLIIMLSLSATFVYRRAGKVDWWTALVLEISTATGGFLGGYLSDFFSQAVLTGLLIAIMVFAGIIMFAHVDRPRKELVGKDAWYLWRRDVCGERYTLNLVVALPVSFLVGLFASMVGIGGGVLKVPMMVLLFGIPMDIAVATSVFMVGITAIGGFGGHLAAGHFDWKMTVAMMPGVLVCAWLGAHTMLRLKRELLQRIFAVVMFVVASALVVHMIVKSG